MLTLQLIFSTWFYYMNCTDDITIHEHCVKVVKFGGTVTDLDKEVCQEMLHHKYFLGKYGAKHQYDYWEERLKENSMCL